jgi:hypothetical protein
MTADRNGPAQPLVNDALDNGFLQLVVKMTTGCVDQYSSLSMTTWLESSCTSPCQGN